jgi:hypothetical protein
MAEQIKDVKAEKPKKEEPAQIAMILNGVTRIYHKSQVKDKEAEGWKVK